jgi:hypothetical protein
MSQNKKMNLMEELRDLRQKFIGSSIWLLVDESKLLEFKAILTSDFKHIMEQF